LPRKNIFNALEPSRCHDGFTRVAVLNRPSFDSWSAAIQVAQQQKGHVMLKKIILLAAMHILAAQTSYAIQPEFEGNDGVLAQVFQTNCLACHSSGLSGPQRNGAPAALNWDDYTTVVANFDRIFTRAAVQKTMPPAFSGLPALNQEQQDALLAWKEAGFPRAETQVSTIEPQYQGTHGIFEQVFAINCIGCHSSTKTGAERRGAPATLNWDNYATAAAFGDRIIARAVTLKTMPPASSGIPTLDVEQQNAMLAWQAAGFPEVSPDGISDANFDYISSVLTLPVVIVGTETYEAKLRFIPMASSPQGIGFELVSALPTTATSAKAATYTPATGAVTIPEVLLLNGAGPLPSNRVSAELALVPGGVSLQFSLTTLNFLTP
jgi:mono/diheme cytochrome c family protein